ncbi:MAG: threonine aldolase family protein, partial [Prevotella sp.]
DYNNGCHPQILKRLTETNDEQSLTYGYDKWSAQAKEKIKTICKDSEAQVWFLTGGTQTNATVIDSILEPYEGAVCVDTGHIAVHEAGAIEFCEHKVITIPGHDGKMDAKTLDDFMNRTLNDSNVDHCVRPGLAYISFPTEFGTLYNRQELDDLYKVCRKYEIPLYVDGARLGYGLAAPGNDIDMPFLAHHCDVFYIGGTKVGALCGEAVVFTHNNGHHHFFTIIKQHGALMAKGRLNGIQFDTLFTDGLYFNISRHAIDMAMKMKAIFKEKGYEFYIDSPSNQQFIILSDAEMERLSTDFNFSRWERIDEDRTICRFVTSWATKEEDIEKLRKKVLG